jgi:hypothetical protein
VITGSSTHLRGLLAADVSDIAFGVILGLCIVVMLMPFVGGAFVLRDIVREQRATRRRAGTPADPDRGQR